MRTNDDQAGPVSVRTDDTIGSVSVRSNEGLCYKSSIVHGSILLGLDFKGSASKRCFHTVHRPTFVGILFYNVRSPVSDAA